jgi:hypothetical protein
VVHASVGVEDVKFVFLNNSDCATADCCKGCGCPALPPDSLTHSAEWAGPHNGVGPDVLTPGFLEQVFRNEQVRRDIRKRIRVWPIN